MTNALGILKIPFDCSMVLQKLHALRWSTGYEHVSYIFFHVVSIESRPTRLYFSVGLIPQWRDWFWFFSSDLIKFCYCPIKVAQISWAVPRNKNYMTEDMTMVKFSYVFANSILLFPFKTNSIKEKRTKNNNKKNKNGLGHTSEGSRNCNVLLNFFHLAFFFLITAGLFSCMPFCHHFA